MWWIELAPVSDPALVSGTMEEIAALDGVLTFVRRDSGETICVAVNLSDQESVVVVPEGAWRAIGTDLGAVRPAADRLALGPWQFALLSRAGQNREA